MSEGECDRPASSEYDPFYETYVGRIGAGPIIPILTRQGRDLRECMSTLAPGSGDFRYALEKWSVKEVLGHLNDTERILGMRAMCIARGESVDLPGFDENDYVAAGNFAAREVDSLIHEFESLRAANVAMLDGLNQKDWKKTGQANGARVSVRALGWIVAGHVDHHLAVLADRYGQAFSSL
jgi:hypothetical protein